MPSTRTTALLINEELKTLAATPAKVTNPDATVLILDSFERYTPNEPTHGEHVKSVFLSQGTAENKIQTADHDPGTDWSHALLSPGPDSPTERLNAFIEFSAAETVEKTRLAVEKWTGPDSEIKTINQSQGSSGATVAQYLLNTSLKANENGEPELTKTGNLLYEGLGRPADLGEMQQRLFDRIDDVMSSSELIAGYQDQLNDTLGGLNQSGGAFFAAAGNEQGYIDGMRAEGVRISDRMTKSVLSVPNAQIVGALDTKGTADTSDDEVADFSANDDNVKYLAPGVDVPIQIDSETILSQGTSLASPHAAASFEAKREQYPHYPGELLHALVRHESGTNCPHSPIAII